MADTPHENEFSPRQLLIHFCLGTLVFVVVGLLAVGLSLLVDFLSTLKVNVFIIYGLRLAEYLLFVVDLLLFILFILRTGWRTAKKIW
jgi:hypothetical protein